jgi:hypothetical protein
MTETDTDLRAANMRATAYETAVDTIADLAEAGHEPIYQDEHLLVVREHQPMGGSTVRTVDLAGERERSLARPSRIRRHTALGDVDSFALYLDRYWDSQQSVTFRTGQLVISTIIDGDPIGNDGVASWGSHKASLILRLSDRLAPWRSADRQLLSQQEFVEFLEDHIADVADPDAADLIELVQWLSGHIGTTWSSAISTKDGARRLTWEESMTSGGKVRTGGTQDIPGEMTIRVPLFQNDRHPEHVDIVARLRIRVRDGRVTLGFILDNLDTLIEDRMDRVVELVGLAGHGPVLTAATV